MELPRLKTGLDLSPGLNAMSQSRDRATEQSRYDEQNQRANAMLAIRQRGAAQSERQQRAKEYDWVINSPNADVAQQRADMAGIKNFSVVGDQVSFLSKDGTSVKGSIPIIQETVRMLQSDDPDAENKAAQFAIANGADIQQAQNALSGDARNLSIMSGKTPTTEEYTNFLSQKRPINYGNVTTVDSGGGTAIRPYRQDTGLKLDPGERTLGQVQGDRDRASRERMKTATGEDKTQKNYNRMTNDAMKHITKNLGMDSMDYAVTENTMAEHKRLLGHVNALGKSGKFANPVDLANAVMEIDTAARKYADEKAPADGDEANQEMNDAIRADYTTRRVKELKTGEPDPLLNEGRIQINRKTGKRRVALGGQWVTLGLKASH